MSELRSIPTLAQLAQDGKKAEVLFWVGCAGSFDDRAKRITRAMAAILQKAEISFAILGQEENCTGDPARRAGHEFLFQMQAQSNIQTLNGYGVKKIITACPHCFNTLKNEYPALGGNYEVVHHTQMIQELLDSGRLKPADGKPFKGKKITFHDPCYLARANGVVEAPRKVLESLDADLTEMKRCKTNGFCCGAGGAQIFKEPEKGRIEVHYTRAKEAIDTGAGVIASGCPFCMTMLTDGVKNENKEAEVQVLDIAELTAKNLGL